MTPDNIQPEEPQFASAGTLHVRMSPVQGFIQYVQRCARCPDSFNFQQQRPGEPACSKCIDDTVNVNQAGFLERVVIDAVRLRFERLMDVDFDEPICESGDEFVGVFPAAQGPHRLPAEFLRFHAVR